MARKFAAVLAAGLTPILCVGEQLAEREAGRTFEVVDRQLDAILDLSGVGAFSRAVIAYERGALLKRHCEQKLAEAKMKVEKIVFASDGSVGTQPADLG